ncbi:MAG: Ni/Fe hydrogenase subunit alpha [Thermoanaerobacteraceae bacterium]|nr:Ni/Fe hydrogenase subunit alpha [Thermoanaerobacteraceae bacterium]
MKRKISLNPVTRLEGHGKIEIFLDQQGNVANAYLQVPELRGFEKFCEGRPAEEMARIMPRICGVCPEAHHLASVKALDALWQVEPPRPAKLLREIMCCAHFIHSHTAHFYVLAAPDFLLGPDADPARRNILGVVGKVGLETGREILKHRRYAQDIQAIIGGKATHPVTGLPGGLSKGITPGEREEILSKGKSCVEFARASLQIFEDAVLQNKRYLDLITGDVYRLESYSMGLVDDSNRLSFYDGNIRVVDQEGREFAKFAPGDYLQHVAERVEEWTYVKFPYLKNVGWRGFTDGKTSGIYRCGPLARINVTEGMATPAAREAYEKMVDTFGGKPIQATLAYHWARLVELLYAAERLVELAEDDAVLDPNVRALPTAEPGEGVGVVEAPRGTLIHHYRADREGMITGVNLIVGTTGNHAAINLSIRRAAEKLIRNGKVSRELLNMVEMVFRAYDPCLACATHSLPGRTPLEIKIYDSRGNLQERLWQ